MKVKLTKKLGLKIFIIIEPIIMIINKRIEYTILCPYKILLSDILRDYKE